jgi:hypothetical protein
MHVDRYGGEHFHLEIQSCVKMSSLEIQRTNLHARQYTPLCVRSRQLTFPCA